MAVYQSMRMLLLILIVFANLAMANHVHADDVSPAFNNWTTKSLHQIFIPPTQITRAHGNIKAVTFFFPRQTQGYPTRIYALDCFDLIFLFLFGPNLDHKHTLEDGSTPGVISTKDPETGYLVTRDRETSDHDLPHDRDMEWRYHFTVTKNGSTVLTAALIEFESEQLGPRFMLHIR